MNAQRMDLYRAWIDYRSPRTPLHYWRSTSGFEVDFLLDETVAIEVKAARVIHEKHERGMRALMEEGAVSGGGSGSREHGAGGA